jgi:acetyl-CoA/propionyl-CoA carboxylase biotin carboxyl carrier protein
VTAVFETVLVANRGEIAVRIIRTLRELGVRAVAVHSDADAGAPHTRLADVAVRIGPAAAGESYLHIGHVLEAAAATGAQAIHPGYGFLSENPAFAHACAEADVVFVGPPAEAIEAMGDKIRAKQLMAEAGVPVVPGVGAPDMDDAALLDAAAALGPPLLVKPSAGGGGKGMRLVHSLDDLPAALAAARREAGAAFGDDALLLERFVATPRHVEIQVLADTHGTVIHLGERECSLQRRHQKVVEEAPSPLLDVARRKRMGASAVAAARACGYAGAGTVEFIVSGDDPDAYHFLEMNTRLQVEHPVTELVRGVDLVAWQLRIAAGEPLDLPAPDVDPVGHAVEARVYAEDPARGFLPTGGRVLALREPTGEGVRVDSGIAAGTVVGDAYDPMLAKIIAWGADRAAALRRLDAALAAHRLLGLRTNVAFLRRLLADDDVIAGRLHTGLVEDRVGDLVDPVPPDDVVVTAVLAHLLAREPDPGSARPFDLPGGWRIGERAWTRVRLDAGDGALDVHVQGRAGDALVCVGDDEPVHAATTWVGEGDLATTVAGRTRRYAVATDGDVVWVGRDGGAWRFRREAALAAAHEDAAGGGDGQLTAPMPGTVTLVHVAQGDAVTRGQALLVVEAMKMEHPVTAPVDGFVAELAVRAGQQVAMDERLAVVATDPRDGDADG